MELRGRSESARGERSPLGGTVRRGVQKAQAPPWVLVAERSPALLTRIGLALQRDGFRVELCVHGAELLERLADGLLDPAGPVRPDLIIAGVRLEGWSGADLAASLRADGWTTPILLTAEPGARARTRHGRDKGRTLVFEVPFEMDDLRTAVFVLLGSRPRPPRLRVLPWTEEGPDRRRHPRLAVDMAVEEFLAGRHLTQRCLDLSAGGLFLTASASPQLGSVLTRKLTLPGDEGTLWVRGEVVHRRHGAGRRGVGVRFVEIREPDRARIARFVARGRGQRSRPSL